MNKNILNDELKNQFAKKYLAYALSTITQRALPDVRDGLKPVHRRLIYAMYLLNLSPKSQFKKSARVVGDVIGKFHPHGDQSVYDALVRLAQDFSTNYPLVDGQGNFGNIDGDNAAAMRYTEAKLTRVSEYLLKDIEEETINFKKTYDGELEEPEILPSQFPNILANGSTGIAVGMATSIPPHNIEEICNALIHLNNNPNSTVRDLLKFIKGPDFPTGGILNDNKQEIFKAYNTGRGFFEIKSRYKIEDLGRGLFQIVITEIPYLVNKSKLIEKIADIIVNKKNKLLDHVSDESDERIRIVLRPKNRNVKPEDLVNSLFEQTDLKNKFFLNMNVLNERNEPRVMNLKDILKSLLKHRYIVLKNKINFNLNKINKRIEILKGFLIVYANLNKIINIIRNSKDPKKDLIKKFKLSILQVDAILEMKLRSLKKIEEIEIKKEFKELEKEKKRLNSILKSKNLQKKEINNEYDSVITEFGSKSIYGPRKTKLDKFLEVNESELESKLEVIENINISLISNQYLKARKGFLKLSSEKFTSDTNLVFNCKTSDTICLISNFGKVYLLSCNKLKFGSVKGFLISSYIKLKEGEKIIDIFNFVKNKKLILATKNGYGFVLNSDDFLGVKKSGKKIFNIKKNDALICSSLIDQENSIYISLILKNNEDKIKLLIFKINEVPQLKKGSGITLFKSKGFFLNSIFTLNNKMNIIDQFNNKLELSKDLNSFISKRGKSGKIIKIKKLPNFHRGHKENIII